MITKKVCFGRVGIKRWILMFIVLGSTFVVNGQQKHYANAFQQIKAMLEGQQQLSFKEAVFLTENAFFNGGIDQQVFDTEIQILTQLAKLIRIQTTHPDSIDIYGNYAIYQLLTNSVVIDQKGGEKLAFPSFSYEPNDFLAEEEWLNTFVTKLLVTRKGNCHSLPFLYKMIADELDVDAHLALAPNHIYLKHRWPSSDKHWYNTELTNRTFPTDAWLMASGYISLDALRNGLYLDALTTKQAIAITLIDLAKGYARQAKVSPKEKLNFQLACIELALAHFPNYINALLLKVEALAASYELKESASTLEKLTELCVYIDSLGYQQMSQKHYLAWLQGKEINKVDQLTPYQLKEYALSLPYKAYEKDLLSLSKNGDFERTFSGRIKQIGQVLIDCNAKQIIGKIAPEKYQIDPTAVGRFLSMDPITAHYPELTPYQFAGNTPIWASDLDGLEPNLENFNADQEKAYKEVKTKLMTSSAIFKSIYDKMKVGVKPENVNYSVNLSSKSSNGGSVRVAGLLTYKEHNFFSADEINLEIYLNPNRVFDEKYNDGDKRNLYASVAEEFFHVGQAQFKGLEFASSPSYTRGGSAVWNFEREVEVRVYRAFISQLVPEVLLEAEDQKDTSKGAYRKPANYIKRFLADNRVQIYFEALRNQDADAIKKSKADFHKAVIEHIVPGTAAVYPKWAGGRDRYVEGGGKTPYFDKLTIEEGKTN